jgi:AcrR family transcriptional regulator
MYDMATPESPPGSSPGSPPVVDLWTRQPPGSRKPRYTLDQIAEAAMRIADTEGIDALSMRRLAAELGAGTMTLYHYVRGKDELLALVTDRVMGELIVPDGEFPEGWRAAMTAIAHRTRQAMLRHPWVFDIAEDPSIGPNGARHFDQSMQAVAELPLSLEDRLDILTTVDAYVFGFCLEARNDTQFQTPDASRAVVDYTIELTKSGDYPQLSALVAELGTDALWRRLHDYGQDESRFDRALSRLLDGFERDLLSGAT